MSKHKITVTVPDSVYMDLQKFKREHFSFGDSVACLCLITRALYKYDVGRCNTNKKAGSGAAS